MENIQLKENEVLETLKQNGFKIIQDKKRFCFGIDAILLANFAEIRNDDNVYDLGTGNGIIPLLLAKSFRLNSITGLEIQAECAQMAERSVKINSLENKIKIVNGDIKNVSKLFPKAKADAVVSNPPYMINQHGKQNPGDSKAIARHEVLCSLDDVVSAAEYLLKPQGRFYMIHRPFRLAEIIVTLSKHNLETKKIRLVHPFADKEPNMVLIETRKFANSRVTIEKPLVVYDTPGTYTAEVQKILEQPIC